MPYERRPSHEGMGSEKNRAGKDCGYLHNITIKVAINGVDTVIPHLTPPTVIPDEKIQKGAAAKTTAMITADARRVEHRVEGYR